MPIDLKMLIGIIVIESSGISHFKISLRLMDAFSVLGSLFILKLEYK